MISPVPVLAKQMPGRLRGPTVAFSIGHLPEPSRRLVPCPASGQGAGDAAHEVEIGDRRLSVKGTARA
jgi:hypothetical protein